MCRLFVLLFALLAASASGAERPNIVMIFTDDQGWHDVGCYGSEIPTPHIDSLARDGVKLNQFYAASSICTPSRFGLLTGQYPTRSQDGLLNALMFLADADKHRGIRDHETTYVSLLQSAGYQTALVGKWHLGHGDHKFWPTEHGFGSFFGHTGGCVDFFSLHYGTKPDWYRGKEIVATEGYATDVITDEAVAVLDRSAKNAAPFYLHIAFNAPHFGKAGDMNTGEIKNKMQPKPADLSRVDSAIGEKSRRAFAAKVIGMDDSIGRILRKLDSLGLSDSTLVIFMTDHGGDPAYGGSNVPLRGGKAQLFEGGLRVPCLARWPGQIPAGSESDAVCCAIDCFPTLCRIAGVDFKNRKIDGRDMLPILKGQPVPSGRELFWCTGKHAELSRSNWTAIRQGDWKMVDAPKASPMLFNLAEDPYEIHDLSEKQPAVLRKLVARASELKSEK